MVPESRSARRHAIDFLVLAGLMVGGALYSLRLGVDRNFDILNYHLYSAFALVGWRYDIDIFPASFHTFFSPLLDVPFFIVQKYSGLYYATALQGVFFGIFIFVVWQVNKAVFLRRSIEEAPEVSSVVAALAATVIGVTGAAALGQAGTTMNEVQVAAIVLASIWIMLRWADRDRARLGPCWATGALLGAAAGLKLTAAVYAPGVVIAIVVIAGLRRSLLPVMAICAGWLLAFSVLYGWWGVLLYMRFESPTFPLFNGIFESPWLPASSFLDNRFKPRTLFDFIVYPYFWAFEPSYRTSELSMRDPRLFLLLISISIVSICRIFRKIDDKIVFGLVFSAISYVIWLKLFSIYRYAIPLEALSGTLTVAVVSIAAAMLPRWRAVMAAAGGAAAAVFLALFTVSPDWGHVPLHASYQIDMQPVPDGSLVAIVGGPAGYLATLIPGRDLKFAGVGNWSASLKGFKVHDSLKTALRNETVNRVAVVRLDSKYTELLAAFGVGLVESQCSPVTTSIDPTAGMLSCPLRNLPAETNADASR